MVQKEKQKLDNIDFSKLSDKEKRELILSMRRLGGTKSPQKRPAPTTDDELWELIRDEIGDEIPRVAVCEDHDAPFDFVADYYFERKRAILVMANREGGKTRSVNIANYLNCEYKPGCEVCVFADIEAQSNKSYNYIKSFVYIKDDQGKKIPKPSIDGDPLRKETRWKNGSKLEVIIASPSGVNSPHPHKVHADEIDLMDREIWGESRSMASSGKGSDGKMIKSQDIATSTRKSTKGLMQEIIDESEKAIKLGVDPPWHVYKFCIFESAKEVPNCACIDKNIREDRLKDLELDTSSICKCDKILKGELVDESPRTLKSICKGKLFKSRGWMEYDDIIHKFTQNTPNVWVAQHECRRPMADGLYLPTWSREKNVIRGYEPRPEYGLIWQGIDWGGCYDEQTEFLTDDGWKSGSEISMNDYFASLDPTTHEVHFQRPIKIYEKSYTGEMHYYKNKNIDLLVTPDHNMFTQRQCVRRNGEEGPWQLTPSSFVSASRKMTKTSIGRSDSCDEPYILREISLKNGPRNMREMPTVEIDSKDWAAFLGMWMAEGHVTNIGNGVVGITHYDESNLEEMYLILKKYFRCVDKRWVEKKWAGFVIRDARLYRDLKQFGKSYEKFLPSYVFEWKIPLLKIYLDWHFRGDGNRNRIYTSSPRLADDLQEIAMYAGMAADISVRGPRRGGRINGREIVGIHPQYIVGFMKTRNEPTLWSRGKQTKNIINNWQGTVYCPSLLKYHTLYVRRNGKAVWCGNSEPSFVVWIQGPLHQPLQVNNTIGTKSVIPQGSYVIFKELAEASMGATRLADKVVRQEIQYKNRFGGGWRVKARFADMAGRQQREDWREHNPPLRTHWYISRDFDPTVECLQALVTDDLLYADEQNAPGICDDYESWHQKDGKEVHDDSSHGPAASRYCLKNVTTITNRFKSTTTRASLAPVVVGREESAQGGYGALVGVSSPSTSDYSSEAWRQTLGSPATPADFENRGNREGNKQPWQP